MHFRHSCFTNYVHTKFLRGISRSQKKTKQTANQPSQTINFALSHAVAINEQIISRTSHRALTKLRKLPDHISLGTSLCGKPKTAARNSRSPRPGQWNRVQNISPKKSATVARGQREPAPAPKSRANNNELHHHQSNPALINQIPAI